MKTFFEFLEEKGFVLEEGKKKQCKENKKTVTEKKGLDHKKKHE
jgi:hypothetical protein